MKKRDDLMSTAAACAKLGISLSQFRRVADDLVPAGTYQNPHYRSGPPAHLWSRRQVANLARRKAVKTCAARCTAPVKALPPAAPTVGAAKPANRRTAKANAEPSRPPVDWAVLFAQRYVDPMTALGPAADAMFDLNRYTRSTTCAPWDRDDIFDLKTSFVELLYRLEYTDRVVRFDLTRPGQVCFDCDGAGCAGEGTYNEGDACERCGGTGQWRPPCVEQLYAFHFTVDGTRYSWMQPARCVRFLVKVDEVSTEMDRGGRAGAEVIMTNMQEGKALVRWVVNKLRDVRPQRTDLLVELPDTCPDEAGLTETATETT